MKTGTKCPEEIDIEVSADLLKEPHGLVLDHEVFMDILKILAEKGKVVVYGEDPENKEYDIIAVIKYDKVYKIVE